MDAVSPAAAPAASPAASEATAQAITRLATMRGFLALALPLAAGYGVNWIMQFTNRLFLSWYSADALAASLPAGMVAYTVQAFFTASVGYVGAFAAQHVGAGEAEEAGAMAWPMIWLAVVAGILGLLVIPFRDVLFSLMGADAVVTRDMATLGAWYFAETLPAVLFAGLCGWFGGLGFTRLVMLMALGICVVSVGLNYWLVFGGLGVPALGLHGAGLATLLSTVIGCAVGLGFFFSPTFALPFGTWRQRNIDPQRFLRFAKSALPRGGTEALEMLAFVVFTAAIAHLGTEQLAANNLVFSLYLLVVIPLVGLGQGITIGVGQAMGAGRIDVARGVVRRAGLLALVTVCVAGLAFIVAPRELMMPYVALDPLDPVGSAARWERILDLGVPLMYLSAIMMFGDGFQLVWRFAVQGAGDTRWPLAMLTITAALLLGAPALFVSYRVAPETWTTWGISSLTACWGILTLYLVVIAGLMAWRYFRGPWSRMSLRA